MSHATITPQQQFAHEGLLHIQSLNKTPMTARQAVEACRKISDEHTFIANEHQGIHLSSYGEVSSTCEYVLAVFHGMTLVFRSATKDGFESALKEVEAYLHPCPTFKDVEPDPDRFANSEEKDEFDSISSDHEEESSDEDE